MLTDYVQKRGVLLFFVRFVPNEYENRSSKNNAKRPTAHNNPQHYNY